MLKMMLLRRTSSLNYIKRTLSSKVQFLETKIEEDNVNPRFSKALEKFHDKIQFNSVLERQLIRIEQLNDIMTRKEKKIKAEALKNVESLPVVLSQFCEPAESEQEDIEQKEDDNVPLASSFPYARFLKVESSEELEGEELKKSRVPDNWMQDYESYDESEEEMTSIYGTPNPNQPVSKVPCGGCGALLHCKDPGIPGYIPSEIFTPLDKRELTRIVCQRCHFLANYNTAINITIKPEDYIKIISGIKDQYALAIILVDLLDFPCSIFTDLAKILGPKRSVVIVGNKVDLIPRDHPNYLSHIKECLRQEAVRLGFENRFIKHVSLISAKTGFGIEELITRLHQIWRTKGDVYLIGCTNVGKSSLFNTLLESDYCKVEATDIVQRATACPWPGTTLNMLKFPILRQSDYKVWLRTQRLVKLQKLKADEEMFRRQQAIKTKNSKFATLIGHIGRTFEIEKKMQEEEKLDPISITQKSGFNNTIFTLDDNKKKYAESKWCYDTPGVIQKDQILHLLTTDEIMKTIPKEMMKARAFLMKPNLSLFLAGLGRLDYIEGLERIRVVVFSSIELPVTLIETKFANEFYEEFLGSEVLGVPILENEERIQAWPRLEASEEFTVKGIDKHLTVCDVVLSSAGWVGVNLPSNETGTFQAWTPQKRGIYIRQPSLLPYGMNLRGSRVPRSLAYHIGKSFTYRKVQYNSFKNTRNQRN